MTGVKKLSIVIPCFNEYQNITSVLTTFDDLLKNISDIEVLVIDGASTDEDSKGIKKNI